MEPVATRIWHQRSHKDARPRINEDEGATQRTTAYDFASWRAGHIALTQNPRSPASNLDVTDDQPSLAKGKGDDRVTLIWSRRNGD
jgi:hypothetical protein